jgi:O-acetyl-ADP-ribose deacetylase (regulator of RNase III)
MITIINGDILEANKDIIGHQVNCKGVMGAGLAKKIKEKYPIVFTEYKKICDEHKGSNFCLGNYQIVKVNSNKWIANLFGQYGYGRDKQYTDYKALEDSLKGLYDVCKGYDKSLALPYNIGCGLAGGEWDTVYEIINDVFRDYEKVYIYKL